MSDSVEPASRARRFPYLAAVVCAASVVTAAWLWMRYSYCWDVTVGELHEELEQRLDGHDPANDPPLVDPASRGPYVRLSGEALELDLSLPPDRVRVRDPTDRNAFVDVLLAVSSAPRARERTRVFVGGRMWLSEGRSGYLLAVDTRRSRFTPQSVAGLVVCALGLFVFAVTLRDWLEDRAAARGSHEP